MGEIKALIITSLSSTGTGIATDEGLKFFVDGALPGEQVQAEVTARKKSYATARLLSVEEPAIERVSPACPNFSACGGCQIMHLSYPAQLLVKQKKVKDALQRIGQIQNIEILPCLASPLQLGYRNKIQLPVVWDGNKKKLGLYRRESHEIIPISKCLIQCPQGEKILNLIQEKLDCPSVRYVLIRNAIFNQEALIVFVTHGNQSAGLQSLAKELIRCDSSIKGVVENVNPYSNNTILGQVNRPLAGRPFIFETLLNKKFKISSCAFFQVNAQQAEHLYAHALSCAEIKGNERVLDAYCGVGALAILAAPMAKEVHGIECVQSAIHDARENARLNSLNNCTFTCGKAEELIEQSGHFDTIFLNPPRKGCASELLSAILKNKPTKIIYISCEPSTLARDLKILSAHYLLKSIQPFDMFPQTMHIETVVSLWRI